MLGLALVFRVLAPGPAVVVIGLLASLTAARADIAAPSLGFGLEAGSSFDTARMTEVAVKSLLKNAQHGDAQAEFVVGLLYARGRILPHDAEQSAMWLERAAAQKVPSVLNELGMLAYFGQDVPKDNAKAVELFSQAADKGYVPAEANLGAVYAMGTGVPQNWSKALEWTRKAADKGNAMALRDLAISYQFGNGLAPDIQRAVALYQRAADLGDAGAQFNLGALYEEGEGVPADPARAFKLYGASARQGNADGERALGMAYRKGIGTARDDDAALTWLLRAAAQNDAGAELGLATAYARGLGVKADLATAQQWRERAAADGNGFADLQIGMELAGKPGPAADFAKCARLLTAAVAQEEAILRSSKSVIEQARTLLGGAKLFLGALTAAGLGVPQDETLAADLIGKALPDVRVFVGDAVIAYAGQGHKPDEILLAIARSPPPASGARTASDTFPFLYYAAAAGNGDAQYDLGRLYRQAANNPQNLVEADKWNRQAAAQGLIPAQMTLVYQLRNGTDGIARDPTEAFRWARQAAEAGDALAESTLADLYRTGTGVAPDAEQFRIWARKAAEQGEVGSEADLGFALLIGFGGPADKVEAMKWLLLAKEGAPASGRASLVEKVAANLARAEGEMSAEEIAAARAQALIEQARQAEARRDFAVPNQAGAPQ